MSKIRKNVCNLFCKPAKQFYIPKNVIFVNAHTALKTFVCTNQILII